MDSVGKESKRADVLVIDDDEIMRDLVADWLEAAGYEVRKAVDGEAGLAEIARAEPALIVSDMCMPGPSGSLLIRSLKHDHPAVPIIVISGHFSLSGCSAEEALALGAVHALAKPVQRGDILRAVAGIVGPPRK